MIDNAFNWDGRPQTGTPLPKSVIYEVHVKGFTKLCPDVAGGIARHLCRSWQRPGN